MPDFSLKMHQIQFSARAQDPRWGSSQRSPGLQLELGKREENGEEKEGEGNMRKGEWGRVEGCEEGRGKGVRKGGICSMKLRGQSPLVRHTM